MVLVDAMLCDGPTCVGEWAQDLHDPQDEREWHWVSPSPCGWVVDDTGASLRGVCVDAIRLWRGMKDGRDIPLVAVRMPE